MFRRRWSGLPDDPDFPTKLKELGYFVNEQDEIRSIKDPQFYFNYFISKSERHNDRQRFAFTIAVQDLIHERLTAAPLSLTKLTLPLNTPSTEPHTPIFISPDLKLKKRIVVLFGEGNQDLGILAHRVLGNKGGVDAGSVVGLVKTLLQGEGGDAFGVVLANTGESCWWPEGKRALSYRQSLGVRMKSAVHNGHYFDPLVNGIPANGNVDEHVCTVFDTVLGNAELMGEDATVEIIGISEGALAVEKYLDENWNIWKDRVISLAILGGGMEQDEIKDLGFKSFLQEKARAYITCTTPLNTPMANPGGNPLAHYNTTVGCPVLSSGEDYHSELTLIKAKSAVLDWMNDVYAADRGRAYKNPVLDVTFCSEQSEESLEFRDRPAFEGYPKRLYPPPNVWNVTNKTETEEKLDEAVKEPQDAVEGRQAKDEPTEPAIIEQLKINKQDDFLPRTTNLTDLSREVEVETPIKVQHNGLARALDEPENKDIVPTYKESQEINLGDARKRLDSATKLMNTAASTGPDAKVKLDDGLKVQRDRMGVEQETGATSQEVREMTHAHEEALAMNQLRLDAEKVKAKLQVDLQKSQAELQMGRAELRDAETKLQEGEREYDRKLAELNPKVREKERTPTGLAVALLNNYELLPRKLDLPERNKEQAHAQDRPFSELLGAKNGAEVAPLVANNKRTPVLDNVDYDANTVDRTTSSDNKALSSTEIASWLAKEETTFTALDEGGGVDLSNLPRSIEKSPGGTMYKFAREQVLAKGEEPSQFKVVEDDGRVRTRPPFLDKAMGDTLKEEFGELMVEADALKKEGDALAGEGDTLKTKREALEKKGGIFIKESDALQSGEEKAFL